VRARYAVEDRPAQGRHADEGSAEGGCSQRHELQARGGGGVGCGGEGQGAKNAILKRDFNNSVVLGLWEQGARGHNTQ
jgi:hypothetical protein